MKNPSWDDLNIFFHVARTGGLSAAARELGISVPTAGRRMLALEQATRQTLFVRSQSGYRLTRAGEVLLQKVQPMQAAARPLADWLETKGERPLVRVSAGSGTATFLAENFNTLWRPHDSFRIAFVTTEARLDIAHREVEIGIRNRPADSGNLASRKMETLRFAPFRNRHARASDVTEWVAVDAANARHPAARWLLARDDVSVCAWASSVATARDLVRAGAGVGVMPCFVGDRDPLLMRAGPLIEELTETQWLVMHDDDRHRPEVRTVIERIASLFAEHAPLLAGERPLSE